MKVIDRVLIAAGPEPRSRALAGVQLLPNGDLLVGYRLASRHPVGDHDMIDDGAVVTTRSSDGGRTWSEPRPVAALPGWDCSGGNRMVQTPDGTLVMFVMKARRVGSPESHVHPIRSTDGGLTWGPMGPEMSLFGGSTEPHAMDRALITSGGDWMLPVYGADEPGGATYAAVAFSPDMGRTWGGKVVVARSSDITFYEAAVTRMPDGRFMAVIRTQDPPFDSYVSHSADEGRTWTEPRALPFQGQTPFLFLLHSGAIACFYRDRDPQPPRRQRKRDRRRRRELDLRGAGLQGQGLELRLPLCGEATRRPPLLRLLLVLRGLQLRGPRRLPHRGRLAPPPSFPRNG